MSEEKDVDITTEAPDHHHHATSGQEHQPHQGGAEPASSRGMRAEETEEMERAAGAPDEGDAERAKQGSGLPEGFDLEQMLRNNKGRAEEA
jgi:hypothetical protein